LAARSIKSYEIDATAFDEHCGRGGKVHLPCSGSWMEDPGIVETSLFLIDALLSTFSELPKVLVPLFYNMTSIWVLDHRVDPAQI
jgi:hypothetical protein